MEYLIYTLASISIILSLGGFSYLGPKRAWVIVASIISIAFSISAIIYTSFWPIIIGFSLNWILKLLGLEPSNQEVLSGLSQDEKKVRNEGLRYMPQYYLELGAITAVRAHLANQKRLYVITDQIGDSYEKDYADTRVAETMLKVAEWALDYLKDVFGEKLSSGDCRALQYAIYKYHPDGKKRRQRWLLRGTRFVYASKPVSQETAEENIKHYQFNLVSGLTPLPPKDWTLS